MPAGSPPRAIVPVLLFLGTVVAVISSLGAPLVPAIASTLGTSLPDAQWALTVTMLVGAVATPVVGRLGDGRHRRRVVLVVLGVVTVGGTLAALPLGLAAVIVGRGLQGIGLGLTPLAITTAREVLTGPRRQGTIAALSITVVAGVGLGYPVAGLIAQLGGVHAAFAAGAGISLLALLSAAVVLPPASAREPRPLDVVGALLLGAGLAALLLALGEGGHWGWTSPVLGVLVVSGLLALGGWLYWENRTAFPLVDLQLARGGALTAHLAALLMGLSNYLLLASVPILAQAPASPRAGFGQSIVVAGLILLPFSASSVLSGRLARLLADRAGPGFVLPVAALIQGVAFVLFALTRTDLWQLFVLMAVAGLGVGAAFAAFPAQIIAAVPAEETGSAMSVNQVLRYIGFASGSALTATLLAAARPTGGGAPGSGGYFALGCVGVGVCLLTAAVTGSMSRRTAEAAAEHRPAEAAVGTRG